jgi:hypothetical protein
MGSAAAVTDCQLLRIEKRAMMSALHREHALSDMLVAYLLACNVRYEEDLIDQLYNSSEKRQLSSYASPFWQGRSSPECGFSRSASRLWQKWSVPPVRASAFS